MSAVAPTPDKEATRSSPPRTLEKAATTATVWYGRATVTLFFLVALGVVVGGAVYTVRTGGHNHTRTTKATVTHAACELGSAHTQVCTLLVKFTVDGHEYSQVKVHTEGEDSYFVGETITIRYDPSQPRRASLAEKDTQVWLVWLLLAFALLMVLLLGWWLYKIWTDREHAANAGAFLALWGVVAGGGGNRW